LRFNKSLGGGTPEVRLLLSVVRENHEQPVGGFKPIIMDFETEGTKIYKITKNKFPVGTVEIFGFLE